MSAPREKATVEYVGHATVLVDLGGVRLLTDPVLRSRVMHLRRVARVDPVPLRSVDAVLISHLHHDHLDFPSLRLLGRETLVVAPRGTGALIRRRGGKGNVVELAAGERFELGSVTIRATRAEHDAGRHPFGLRVDPLGYVIEGDRRSVYFAGDTDLFPAMSDLAPVDVALLPIWGWGPSLGPGHLDPRGAAEAAGLLRARLAIPIHWGTYYPIHLGLHGAPGFTRSPAAEFEREARARAPATEVRVLQAGEETLI